MRRISELVYTIAFFGCGLWALSSGLTTLFSGLSDLNTTGTWASALMVAIAVVIKLFGEVQNMHTKTLVFVGLTALYGGIWGIGTILVLLSGALMLSRGFKQIKVLKEQTSLKELRQIRKEKLAEVEDEEVNALEEEETQEKKPSVSEELLEGFVGSEDHKREIRTWIDQSEFDKLELTPEEVRAKAKQEIRRNKLSLETLLALEELGDGEEEDEEVDLTYVNLDLPTNEEDNLQEVEESYKSDEPEGGEISSVGDDVMELTLEDLMNQ